LASSLPQTSPIQLTLVFRNEHQDSGQHLRVLAEVSTLVVQ